MTTWRGLVMVGCFLSGCAAGGPAGPEQAQSPRAIPAALATPVQPPDLTLPTADGAAVPAMAVGIQAPTAVILALHGFGDYGASTFGMAAEAWAEAGIATYAPDQRGFGRGATRGRWPGADALIADARAYARAVRARHPDLPLILLGHSMGGGVALAAAAEGADVDALILAAPAIWGGTALNPLQRWAAWIAAATVPDKRFTGEGVVEIRASDNDAALTAIGRDPFYLTSPSARELMGLVRVVDAAATAAPKVAQPTLLLLGARDEILPNDRVRVVHARQPGPREVKLYAEGWHLLFRDLQAPRVWADVAAWVGGFSDTGRDVAAQAAAFP
ncbi:MAG: alpha/beta fold hydrolase [Pseudomonadota bacterium]